MTSPENKYEYRRRRSGHPHRRSSAHRGRDRERNHHTRIERRHHGARHREHDDRPRPPRRLGHCPAHLRRLHPGAWHRLGQGGRECARLPDPAQCRADPQPDDRRPVRARPRHALLSFACAGLGGRGLGVGCRPCGHGRLAAMHQPLAQQLHRLLCRCQTAPKRLRRQRTARHLRQRLLGTSRIQAAAGTQPDGVRALPGGLGLAARSVPPARRCSAAKIHTRTSSSAVRPA